MADLLAFEAERLRSSKATRKQARAPVLPVPVVDPPQVPDDELRERINRAAAGRPWIWLPVEPMGAVRQTQADRWKQRPAVLRYRAWRDRIRHLAAQVDIEDGAHWLFIVPMAASWSQRAKRERAWQLHRQKPDADNMLKAVLDALLGAGDEHMADVRISKRWWHHGGIVLIQPGNKS